MKCLSLISSISDTWCLCPKFTRPGYPNHTPRYKRRGLQLLIVFIAAFVLVNSLANVRFRKDLGALECISFTSPGFPDTVATLFTQDLAVQPCLLFNVLLLHAGRYPYMEMIPRIWDAGVYFAWVLTPVEQMEG